MHHKCILLVFEYKIFLLIGWIGQENYDMSISCKAEVLYLSII